MIYITQLIYIKEGEEEIFHEFENVALPLLKKYSGELLLRIRPSDDALIEGTLQKPYEIHFITFSREADLQDFMTDEDRKQYLHLKKKAIQSVILVKGERM
ncbi:MAG: DUF1330 domain-containing protein [Chitinophagales bacterium]